jgi:hypothetical protein
VLTQGVCFGALEFHHLDPGEKRLEVNAKGVSLALETLRAEAQKCILLCANCHAEVERGLATLPATVQGGPDEYPIRLALGHSPIHNNPG